MFGFKQPKRPPQKYAAQITVNGKELPVEITIEPRRGSRFSIGKKKVMMRLMQGITNEGIQQEMVRLQQWVQEVSVKKPTAIAQFDIKTYHSRSTTDCGQT